jgi:hypothetical protein
MVSADTAALMQAAQALIDAVEPDEARSGGLLSKLLRDAATAGKLKAMGLQPGWPDILLVNPSGRLHALELKRGDRVVCWGKCWGTRRATQQVNRVRALILAQNERAHPLRMIS